MATRSYANNYNVRNARGQYYRPPPPGSSYIPNRTGLGQEEYLNWQRSQISPRASFRSRMGRIRPNPSRILSGTRNAATATGRGAKAAGQWSGRTAMGAGKYYWTGKRAASKAAWASAYSQNIPSYGGPVGGIAQGYMIRREARRAYLGNMGEATNLREKFTTAKGLVGGRAMKNWSIAGRAISRGQGRTAVKGIAKAAYFTPRMTKIAVPLAIAGGAFHHMQRKREQFYTHYFDY